MRALVTGGAGFIGSHLVDALVDEGAEVHVLDDFSSGRLENLESALRLGAHLHPGDVTDPPAMTALVTDMGFDVVFHLAAQIAVCRSTADPAFDAHVNVAGTAAVLDAARRGGVGRVVLASTAAVYGNPSRLPTSERAPLDPLSPYGAGKAAAELYLALYGRRHRLSTLALRMSNVYGPRQDPHGEAGVVAIFSGAAAAGRPAGVYGDGRQTRDYLHVSDAVAAFMAAAGSDVTGVLNVGTGTEVSVLRVAELLGLEVVHAAARAEEVRRSCLDPSAAERALAWRARTAIGDALAPARGLVPA
jgi:UDP-glucose 4-epimerase